MYNPLDVLNLPLHGMNLIEASAGTGKTYNLIIIYIRLLLCLGNKSDFSRPLTVKEILVVTFTKSAAQSLRYRIRKSIHQFRLDCMRGYSDNFLFSKLLSQIHNMDLAINQLFKAERKIDQASIFTIHRFCQRILTQNTIELNMLFNTTIVDDDITLYQQVCTDFWRRNFYSLPLNIISLIQEHWKTPNSLLNDVLPYIYGSKPKIYYCNIYENRKSVVTYYEQIIIYIDHFKKKWHKNKHNIITIINSYDINRRKYNKKNLIRWTNIIDQWIEQPTINHTIPSELKYFTATELNNNHKNINSIHDLFNIAEKIYQKLSFFKALIFDISINEIRQYLNETRHLRSEITFNDVIDVVANSLNENKENKLAHIIRKNYPVAIIDEFQDTDQQQYNIFRILYFNYLENGLILIGDPKQSIYAFRKADIFDYMKIRHTIHNKYTLNINWRSSSGIVNAINQLFQFTSNPFIFKDIPFIPSVITNRNNTYKFLVNNKPQTAMCFWLHPKETITIDEYKQAMAKECSDILHNLLYEIHKGTAWLENEKYKRKLQISDITILVRNHEEASLIKAALSKVNISTIFLSSRENIFETIESYELLLLLQAILFPERRSICTALTTVFFGLNADNIENINNNESKWEKILEEFSEYYSIWKKHGILLTIQKIIFSYKVPEKLFSVKNGETTLINILHLGELLQHASTQLQDEYSLIDWLTEKITQPQNRTAYDQALRLSSNHKLIKISTIHKAKGLEFPLTFLPFIANFSYKKNLFFHDRKTYETYVDISKSKSNLVLADEERLSEDLRLLYVAITRSVYHCSIGIGPIVHRYKKKSNTNDLHHSALGYLIQKKTSGNAEQLKQHLKMLNICSNGDISFRIISQTKKKLPILPIINLNKSLFAKKWKISKNITPWSVTSFSILRHNNFSTIYSNFQKQLEINTNIQLKKNNVLLTQHTFPKGKLCGSFFHSIFEKLDFKKNIDIKWLHMHMEKYNIDSIWAHFVQQWIYVVTNTPLNNENLTLAQIAPENKKTELKFHLPINTNLTSQKLNYLCKYYDSLSHRSPSFTFLEVKGMLHGFIDLIFRWNNRYYLLDYKTNWLGDNDKSYIYSKMEHEMIKYNYSLQYQLYTLALHRFLRNRLTSYNYEKDFGGIYYLFIRGMNGTPFSNGICFFRPLSIFINKLDNLFSGTE